VSDWHNLRFTSKIEITAPPTRKGGITAQIEEEAEYIYSDRMGPVVRGSMDRKIRLTDEVVTFHWDYPDDFKKLVSYFRGDKQKAYEAYRVLNKPVPADWETTICDGDGEHHCDC